MTLRSSGVILLVMLGLGGSDVGAGHLPRGGAERGCRLVLTPTGATVGASGGTGSVAVATSGCGWAAASKAAFITLIPGALGAEDGRVFYAVAPNPSRTARKGEIAIGSEVFTVVQLGNTTLAPALTYDLSDGALGSFFDTYLLIANPHPVSAPITLSFRTGDGSIFTMSSRVAATSRLTLPLENVAPLVTAFGHAATVSPTPLPVATRVTSTDGLPLIVEASTYFDGTYGGGHTVTASQAQTSWYFAEGSEAVSARPDASEVAASIFDTYLLLVNPNPSAATVTVDFLLESGAAVTRRVVVGAEARRDVFTGAIAELSGLSFAMALTSDVPITAARAQYFGDGYTGGHASSGSSTPSPRWSFAEGETTTGFETYLLVANPGGQTATLSFRYHLSDGTTVIRQRSVAARARLTVGVATEDPALGDASFWMEVVASAPVVVERAMYWRGASGEWTGGHATPGARTPTTVSGLAEGAVGGPLGFETYLSLANPGATPAEVEATFLRANGATIRRTFTVAGGRRLTVQVNAEVPSLQDEGFGMLLRSTNDAPFFAERSMYWAVEGQPFVGASSASALPLRLSGSPP